MFNTGQHLQQTLRLSMTSVMFGWLALISSSICSWNRASPLCTCSAWWKYYKIQRQHMYSHFILRRNNLNCIKKQKLSINTIFHNCNAFSSRDFCSFSWRHFIHFCWYPAKLRLWLVSISSAGDKIGSARLWTCSVESLWHLLVVMKQTGPIPGINSQLN